MRSQRDTWGETLAELGTTNPDIVVLDGDLANSTKADAFARAHPDRFLEMGIAEQNMSASPPDWHPRATSRGCRRSPCF